MLETLSLLPDTSGRRMGSVALGYDVVNKLRQEHAALAEIAATACGVTTTALSKDALMKCRTRYATARAAARDVQIASVLEAVESLRSPDLPLDAALALSADAALWLLALGHTR